MTPTRAADATDDDSSANDTFHPMYLRMYYLKSILRLRPPTPPSDPDFVRRIWRPRRRYRYIYPSWEMPPTCYCNEKINAPLSLECTNTFLLYSVATTSIRNLFHVSCLERSMRQQGKGVTVQTPRVSPSVIQHCLHILSLAGELATDQGVLFCLLYWPFVMEGDTLQCCPVEWWEHWCMQRLLVEPSLSYVDRVGWMTSRWHPLQTHIPLTHNTFSVTSVDDYVKTLRQLRTLLPTQSILRVSPTELDSLVLWWGWLDAHHIGVVYAVAYSEFHIPSTFAEEEESPVEQTDPAAAGGQETKRICCPLHTGLDTATKQSAWGTTDVNKFFFSLVYYVEDPNAWASFRDIQLMRYRDIFHVLRRESIPHSEWYAGCFDPLRMAYCIPSYTPMSPERISILLDDTHQRCPLQL